RRYSMRGHKGISQRSIQYESTEHSSTNHVSPSVNVPHSIRHETIESNIAPEPSSGRSNRISEHSQAPLPRNKPMYSREEESCEQVKTHRTGVSKGAALDVQKHDVDSESVVG